MASMTFTRPSAVMRMGRIEALLRTGDKTVYEIAEGVFITIRYAREYVAYIHKLRMVHIADYAYRTTGKGSTTRTALYRLGPGIDAPKPAALTPKESQARHRARVNLDPDLSERKRAVRRALRRPATPDWAASWVPRKSA